MKAGKKELRVNGPTVTSLALPEVGDEENVKYKLHESPSQEKDGESRVSSSPEQFESSPFVSDNTSTSESTSPGESRANQRANQSSPLDPKMFPAVKENVQDGETPTDTLVSSTLFVDTTHDVSENSSTVLYEP